MEAKKIAKMIKKQLEWTNGYRISDERYTEECLKVANKIIRKYNKKQNTKLAEQQVGKRFNNK